MRQLKQRIALRAYLQPLELEDTTGYIHCRLQLAGANSEDGNLFPGETVARVHHFSRGIPRLINTISDNAMITAFARQLTVVPPGIIDEVADELRLRVSRARTVSVSILETRKGADQTLSVGQSLLQVRHPF